jgi:hypothetical protein
MILLEKNDMLTGSKGCPEVFVTDKTPIMRRLFHSFSFQVAYLKTVNPRVNSLQCKRDGMALMTSN